MDDSYSRIAPGHRIEGTIRAGSDLVLEGHLVGRLESDHEFVVEEGGILEADTTARRLVVRGVVVGDVEASEQVIVEGTGRIQGDLRTGRLSLHPGGAISGRVETNAEVRPPRGGTSRGTSTRGRAGAGAARTSSFTERRAGERDWSAPPRSATEPPRGEPAARPAEPPPPREEVVERSGEPSTEAGSSPGAEPSREVVEEPAWSEPTRPGEDEARPPRDEER